MGGTAALLICEADVQMGPPSYLLLAIASFWCSLCAVDAGITDFFTGDGTGSGPVSHLNLDDTGVTAGMEHACALIESPARSRLGASVACWGSNDRGQLNNIPADLFVQIAAGDFFTCGVTETMQLRCWGDVSSALRSQPYAGTKFVQVSIGESHICGITAAKAVRCFGDDSMKQVAAAPSASDADFVQVSCARHACCALRTNGTLACFGSGPSGLLNGAPGDVRFVQVSVGYGGSGCGLTESSHDITCWGALAAHSPVIFKSLAPGAAPAAASTPTPSRSPSRGGSPAASATATPWPSLTRPGPFVQVSMSRSFGCGLRADGTLDCFGDTTRLWATPSQVSSEVAADGSVVLSPKQPPPASAVIVELSTHFDSVCAVMLLQDGASSSSSSSAVPEPRVDCWDSAGRMDAPVDVRPVTL